MLAESTAIEGIYGIPVRAPTTLLALDMTASPVNIEIPDVTSGHIPLLAMSLQRANQEYVGKLATYDESHRKVVPIAIFIDIDSANI